MTINNNNFIDGTPVLTKHGLFVATADEQLIPVQNDQFVMLMKESGKQQVITAHYKGEEPAPITLSGVFNQETRRLVNPSQEYALDTMKIGEEANQTAYKIRVAAPVVS